MARASGGANNMRPLSWGGHKQKRSQSFRNLFEVLERKKFFKFLLHFKFYLKTDSQGV